MRSLCNMVKPGCTIHCYHMGADGSQAPATAASMLTSLYAISNDLASRGAVFAVAKLAAPGANESRSDVQEMAMLAMLSQLAQESLTVDAKVGPALEGAVNAGTCSLVWRLHSAAWLCSACKHAARARDLL